MGKLMVVVTRFLSLCAVLLVIPAIAAAWLPLLGLVLAFAAPCAHAVPLPTGDTALSGTTLAQRPELAGTVVEDQLIPYSFQGEVSSVSGVIKNRVVRSVDGTLKFYWRIIPDTSSIGVITALRLGGFGGFALDGDFHLDSPGSVGPDTARNFGGGFVNFLFSHGVGARESSYFFFLDTQATAYSNTGTYDLICADNKGCISPLFTTFAPAVGAELPVVSVPGTANWIDTQVDVVEGDLLAITATGLWTEGDTTNGPDGVEKPWPDNFFNFADIGVCMYCAQTATAHWGALIGYIGSSPPAAGSYTSTAVFQEATKVFYVGGNYEASAPASGRLWLNKNTDAYSNYTVDNGGQVEATIEVSPPETDIQYTERAQVAAASINALEPLGEARDFCVRAVADHIRDEGLKYWIKEVLGKDLGIFVDPTALLIQGVGDLVKIQYRASNGQWENATWDFGRLIFRLLGELPIPRFQLFGIVGVPALDCTMAGFWLTGKLGGQLGRLLREKLRPPSTVDASIAGAWTLERSAPITCINFSKGCLSTPIHVRVYDCTATQCTISRSDGDWQLAHTITRRGATWSADFEDIGVSCNDNLNVARIVLRFSVTTSEGNQAKSVGGFYKVQAASNPPDCADNARARYLLYGSR